MYVLFISRSIFYENSVYTDRSSLGETQDICDENRKANTYVLD